MMVLSFAYYKIADYFNIVDKPNHRSSHTINTIRGGGILFYFAILIYFIWSDFNFPLLFVGITMIAVVSFIDDLHPLPPKLRLPVQFISIVLVLLQLNLDFPYYILLLLLICGVGFINVYNFMDGINGLTGLYSLVVVLFMIVFNEYSYSFIDLDLLVFIALSLIIFGFYNFRKKALFFSGDVGSISMGVIFFFLLLKLYAVIQAPSVILIFSVYGVDGVITILKRLRLKERISEAHRRHVYQILVDKAGTSHLTVSALYAGLQAVLCSIFYFIYEMSILAQIIISLVTLLLTTLLYLFANYKYQPDTLIFEND